MAAIYDWHTQTLSPLPPLNGEGPRNTLAFSFSATRQLEKITFGMSDIIYHSIRLHSSQVWAGNRTRDLIYSLQKLRDGPLSGSIFLNKRPSTCIWCQIECKSSQSTLGGKGAHLFFSSGICIQKHMLREESTYARV